MDAPPISATAAPPPDRAQLRVQLDTLATSGAASLRHWRLRLALREAVRWLPLALAVGPLALIFARVFAGAPAPRPGLAALAVWCAVGLAFYLVLHVAWTMVRYRPVRATALALHDRVRGTKDRLVTADEFLRAPDLDGDAPHHSFMRAAVDDARASAHAALAAPLPSLPVPGWSIRTASWWGVPVALVLVLLGRIAFTPGDAAKPGGVRSAATLADTPPPPKPPAEPAAVPRRPPRPPAAVPPEPAGASEKASPDSKPLRRVARREQPIDGQPGTGSGAQASTSNASSQAAGLASNQRTAPPQKKPEAARPEDPEEDTASAAPKNPRRRPTTGQMALDANAGQGKSAGSSSSLQQIESPEESDRAGAPPKTEVEDEAADDEDEHEKSNSVNKPMGDTKPPPVNRNLSNRPPEGDEPGNGRGGPGDIKKTRGVPSMILGIPVPDRVPGMPGPGRSKVTQEFTRPKEESHPAVAAVAQPPRTGPIGHVEQPDLPPWRRTLIENYFLSIHGRGDESPETPTTPPPNR